MMILFIICIWYLIIGASLATYWARDSIKKATSAGEEFDSLRFLIKCCFKWPCMIANKDLDK